MSRVGLPGPEYPKELGLNCRKDGLAQVMRVKVGGKAHSKGWSIMVEIKKEILAWWLRHVILAT